jgi:hypothetical protein
MADINRIVREMATRKKERANQKIGSVMGQVVRD